jgi:RHS repeat-associated protein
VLQDANWNVIALTNTSGVVQERYTYSSFGKLNVFDASFTPKSTSSLGLTRTFTGQTYDAETGLMLYRNRIYHPTLGRFVQRDPIGYEAHDVNLYRYLFNASVSMLDPTGNQGVNYWNDKPLPTPGYQGIGSMTNQIRECERQARDHLLQQMYDALEACIKKKCMPSKEADRLRDQLRQFVKNAQSTNNSQLFQGCWNWVQNVHCPPDTPGVLQFNGCAWDYLLFYMDFRMVFRYLYRRSCRNRSQYL